MKNYPIKTKFIIHTRTVSHSYTIESYHNEADWVNTTYEYTENGNTFLIDGVLCRLSWFDDHEVVLPKSRNFTTVYDKLNENR